MFNPFKKKEQSYSLDEMTLPSLNDTNNSLPQSSPLESSQIPGTDSMPGSIQEATPAINPSNELDNHPASSDSIENQQLASENPFKDQSSFPPLNSFQNSNSFSNDSTSTQSNQDLPNNENLTTELHKIQLETIEKKVSLLDTKVSSIEDKIEKIYQMISLEVKPETKMKIEMVNK